MHDPQPDVWHKLRAEFAAGRQWVDRGVVLGYAVLTGCIVVGFTLLGERTRALAHPAVDTGRRGRGAVVDAAFRARCGGFGHPGGDRRARRPLARRTAPSLRLAAAGDAQDRTGLGQSAGRLVGRSRRADGAGRRRRDAPCAALAVAACRHRCPRPDGGRCGGRHRGGLQHAARRVDLRTGAAVSAAPGDAQRHRADQHRACRAGRGVGVRQRQSLRAVAGAAPGPGVARSGAARSVVRGHRGRAAVAAGRRVGARPSGSLQPLAGAASAAFRRGLRAGGGSHRHHVEWRHLRGGV